jgi:hypothetical protein
MAGHRRSIEVEYWNVEIPNLGRGRKCRCRRNLGRGCPRWWQRRPHLWVRGELRQELSGSSRRGDAKRQRSQWSIVDKDKDAIFARRNLSRQANGESKPAIRGTRVDGHLWLSKFIAPTVDNDSADDFTCRQPAQFGRRICRAYAGGNARIAPIRCAVWSKAEGNDQAAHCRRRGLNTGRRSRRREEFFNSPRCLCRGKFVRKSGVA